MYQSRSHFSERNLEGMKYSKERLKKIERPVQTRCTFLFRDLIIRILKLSVLNLEHFYVEWIMSLKIFGFILRQFPNTLKSK